MRHVHGVLPPLLAYDAATGIDGDAPVTPGMPTFPPGGARRQYVLATSRGAVWLHFAPGTPAVAGGFAWRAAVRGRLAAGTQGQRPLPPPSVPVTFGHPLQDHRGNGGRLPDVLACPSTPP